MRPLQALLKGSLSFGGTGAGFDAGPFWGRPDLWSPLAGDKESIAESFEGYVQGAYKANGIVFACIGARARVFSEARFQYQQMVDGRPGELFDDGTLSLLDMPWPNGTTGELLFRMEQDASLAGNHFLTLAGAGTRLRRLRPDWVTILTGSPTDDPFDIEAEVIGYIYQPRTGRHHPPVLLSPDRVAHFSPVPDPEAQWRGMSWITPVVREVKADSAATKHKLKFFENGTTANFVVSYGEGLSRDQFLEYVAAYKEAHQGVDNAYKTIHLGGGADVTPVSANLKELDFKAVQGGGETRIAAASGAGAVVAMLSEGMQGSSLNSGNYQAAKRQFGDMTIRPLWRTAAASLAKFVTVPESSRLWYDARDIAFLQQDAKDDAEILSRQMLSIESGVRAGFKPETVMAAVRAGDLSLLEHTGLFSVQLQPPGSSLPPINNPPPPPPQE